MLKTLTVAATAAAFIVALAPQVSFAGETTTTTTRHGKVVRHHVVYNNCKHAAHSGTAGGAILGALAGQALGHNTTSTVVGAGVGAAAGHKVRYDNCKKRYG
jgi:outer membrane lipoprotein SlyB